MPCAALALDSVAPEVFDELDFPHPFCERRVSVDVAGETFTELANPIPGVEDYNELVRLYQARDWERFDAKAEIFRKVQETSPLMEPFSFLAAQASFDRAKDAESAKQAERLLRNALLLHPRSSLVPAASVGMAAFWMNERRYANALALYRSLKTDYPGHPLRCLFDLGVGEAAFLLQDTAGARAAFGEALKICPEAKQRLGAALRLADADWKEGRKEAAAGYERVLERDLPRVEAWYPAALHQLGELKYREGKLPAARHYFTRFLTTNRTVDTCVPYALKRLADISLRTGGKRREVVGKYLAVSEGEGGVIGRFSRLHALLLGLPDVAEAERVRRLKLVDEELPGLGDSRLVAVLRVERALGWLASGEIGAVEYLTGLDGGAAELLRKPRLAALARDGIARALGRSDRDTLEKYHSWVAGSGRLKSLRDRYARQTVEAFGGKLKASALPEALAELERWRKSAYWDPGAIPSAAVDGLARAFLSHFVGEPDPAKREREATELLERRDLVEPLFARRNGFVLSYLMAVAGDGDGLRKIRSPASLPKPADKSLSDYYHLASAVVALRLKDTRRAEASLRKVGAKELEPVARRELASLYRDGARYREAYRVERQAFDGKPESAERLRSLVLDGKLWDRAPEVLRLAEPLALPGERMAPFHHLVARSYEERKQCPRAIPAYEKTLALDKEGPFSAESLFRLGKCLFRQKEAARARAVWEELLKRDDPFWSPLARNEIKLLTP